MENPFKLDGAAKIFDIIKERFKTDPSYGWKAYQWMNTPNPLLCGVTPKIYIESGHGEKLLKLLKEEL